MTLTTQTGIRAKENIRQDIPLNTEIIQGNKQLPSGQVLSEDAQILFNKSIVAKPLGAPASEEIRIKDLTFKYRWVNRQGAGGSRYARQKAMGWTDATPEQVEAMSVELTKDDNRILWGDLILMKLPMDVYQSAMKANMEKALFLQRARGMYVEGASTDVMSDTTGKRVTVETAHNPKAGMTAFIPSEAELDAKMPIGGKK